MCQAHRDKEWNIAQILFLKIWPVVLSYFWSNKIKSLLFCFQINPEMAPPVASRSSLSSRDLDYGSLPKSIVLCIRTNKKRKSTNSKCKQNSEFKFFLWNQPDELVELKWCPNITPLLIMSYLMN